MAHVSFWAELFCRLTILVIIVVIKLANASGALGELSAGAVGVADAVNFLTITAVYCVVAGAGGVDHCLTDRAALLWDVVVVEFLGCDGGDGGEAEE